MAQYGQNPQLSFWHRNVGGLSLEHWINDGLMALFFLLIGLELERELYAGELSNVNLIGAGILGIGFTM